jgi:hypothetical protein
LIRVELKSEGFLLMAMSEAGSRLSLVAMGTYHLQKPPTKVQAVSLEGGLPWLHPGNAITRNRRRVALSFNGHLTAKLTGPKVAARLAERVDGVQETTMG